MSAYPTPNTVTTCLEEYLRQIPPPRLFGAIMCLWGAVACITALVLMWVL